MEFYNLAPISENIFKTFLENEKNPKPFVDLLDNIHSPFLDILNIIIAIQLCMAIALML